MKGPEINFSYGRAVLRGRPKRAMVELLSNLLWQSQRCAVACNCRLTEFGSNLQMEVKPITVDFHSLPPQIPLFQTGNATTDTRKLFERIVTHFTGAGNDFSNCKYDGFMKFSLTPCFSSEPLFNEYFVRRQA